MHDMSSFLYLYRNSWQSLTFIFFPRLENMKRVKIKMIEKIDIKPRNGPNKTTD